MLGHCYLWSRSAMFGAVVGEVYSIQIMIAPLVSSNSSIQHYVIKFVRGFQQVGCILQVLRFPPPIKLTAMI